MVSYFERKIRPNKTLRQVIFLNLCNLDGFFFNNCNRYSLGYSHDYLSSLSIQIKDTRLVQLSLIDLFVIGFFKPLFSILFRILINFINIGLHFESKLKNG